MKITRLAGDDAVLGELGARIARLRLERNLTQAQLAAQAGIGKRTVERLETGAVATQLSGFLRVCRALGLIERVEMLVPEPVPSPVARLKSGGKQRQRASSVKAARSASRKWQWGEK
jgi:transcriptional regulator with XRE-family HTH domain